MRLSGSRLMIPVLAGLLLADRTGVADDRAPKAAPLTWHFSLAQGAEEARHLRRPIFVRVGAEWCPFCQKMAEEVLRPEIQQALSKWSLVVLDADRDAADSQAMSVGPVPALRVLSPRGRVVDSRDGFLTANELVEWLDHEFDKAKDAPTEDLIETSEPSAVAIVRLVRQFDRPDALLREASIKRLASHPDLAASTVVDAFVKGSLQTRLAALDLLAGWHAPVDQLDPWRPDTLTVPRFQTLRAWSRQAVKSVDEVRSPMNAEQRFAAARDIDLLLTAADADVSAIRERLARLGRNLLPEAVGRLKRAETDRSRERLRSLRYRLVAADPLVLQWPGGLDRLAATDVATRHEAVDELVGQATSGDQPLLLELFSDPDPLVREIALRGLDKVSRGGVSSALTSLLADPEPNVRAAVLKQLAEHPSASLVPELSDYVTKETDPDLVVHATRVLRELPDRKGLNVLIGLSNHDNWRVRSEATEALGRQLERSSSERVAGVDNALAALIRRLGDSDGFVVGRAIVALRQADRANAVDPVMRAAESHPELAVEAVLTLSGWTKTRDQSLIPLRKFCSNTNPAVRVAAITAVSDATAQAIEPELHSALTDPESLVRVAAAQSVFGKLRNRRSGEGADVLVRHETPAARDEKERNRPSWIEPVLAPLTAMLKAASAEERVAAALPLIAIGGDRDALPTLLATVREKPDLVDEASPALAWTRWPDRIDLFDKLRALAPDANSLEAMIHNLTEAHEPRAAEPLWRLAASDDLKVETAEALLQGLRVIFFGPNYYNMSKVPLVDRQHAKDEAKSRAESGPEWQRVIALALLASASRETASGVSRHLVEDPRNSESLRRDAFQVLLVVTPSFAEGQGIALAALGQGTPSIQKLALIYLTSGAGSLRLLREKLTLIIATEMDAPPRSANELNVPKLPRALKPEAVRPLLNRQDAETAALAGYVLILLGASDGLESLLQYWSEPERRDANWDKRVAQAIARVNDDRKVPILDQIYAASKFETTPYGQVSVGVDIKDFYWTIRRMTGPNARNLRRRIRHDVGMAYLRGEASRSN